MITFLLGWCALSLIGTLLALSLIRTGKRRQPEADDGEMAPVVNNPGRYKA
ncbi:hypothetical protein ACIPL1_22650 [Pseudomonas sp. NPDC090202]|uniref:hypothetical protein n=1 Tax=unclassified Pseudomonas TaxID=196821 RepID=UPI00380A7AA8